MIRLVLLAYCFREKKEKNEMGGLGSGASVGATTRVLEGTVPKMKVSDLKPEAGSQSFFINGVLVYLVWTDCNYGGQRPWFLCPCCHQRKGLLYFVGTVVRCRDCFKLIHQTKRVSFATRAIWRSNTIRRRLGWEPAYKGQRGYKPKWMRWATYDRLVQKLSFYEAKADDRLWRDIASLKYSMINKIKNRNLVET
jgi:hypothetical protein